MSIKKTLIFLLPFFIFVAPNTAENNTSNRSCLSCHGLTTFESNSNQTIFVDKFIFERSMHGRLLCTSCHKDIKEYPHGLVKKIDCKICHDSKRRYDGRFHASSFVNSILLRTNDGFFVTARPSRITSLLKDNVCLSCHSDSSVNKSIHGEKRCVECHADATANHSKLKKVDCGICHIDEKGKYALTIHGRQNAG